MERDVQIWGAITALTNLMEATWATMAIDEPDPVAAIQSVRNKMLAEFDLPPRDTPETEGHYLAGQAALSFLETFWARCEDRVRHQQ